MNVAQRKMSGRHEGRVKELKKLAVLVRAISRSRSRTLATLLFSGAVGTGEGARVCRVYYLKSKTLLQVHNSHWVINTIGNGQEICMP